jgi:hypothetical protein
MAFDPSSVRPYKARHFNHLPMSVEPRLWECLSSQENIVRLETAVAMRRPAVEGISDALVSEFGSEINHPGVKQVIGHMVKQIMGARGYEVDRPRLRTRSGFFSTGMSFRPKLPHGPDRFNRWLDEQVRSANGALDPAKLARVAGDWGVFMGVNGRGVVAMERLELGVKLRPVVPPSAYQPADSNDEETGEGVHDPLQSSDIGLGPVAPRPVRSLSSDVAPMKRLMQRTAKP